MSKETYLPPFLCGVIFSRGIFVTSILILISLLIVFYCLLFVLYVPAFCSCHVARNHRMDYEKANNNRNQMTTKEALADVKGETP